MISVKPLYCHFSFKRPKSENYGIFACACYTDKEYKNLVARNTEVYKLWLDNQCVTAMQSYWFALKCIYEWQEKINKAGFTNILLVCNNKFLVNTIADSKKSSFVGAYLEDVYRDYVNGNKYFNIPIGICNAVKYDRARKFCSKEFVTNFDKYHIDNNDTVTKLSFEDSNLLSVDELLDSDTNTANEPSIDLSNVVELDWNSLGL